MPTIVDKLYEEANDIINKLQSTEEISLASDAKNYFTKVYVLSAASYFEKEVQDLLINYIKESSSNNELLTNFVKKKAINFQYHTFFNWGEKDDPTRPGKNANTFFSLFGNTFKVEINEKISSDVELQTAIKGFLEIGHIRNILVHSNFAAYNSIPKTIEEFHDLFVNGKRFIDFFKKYLSEYDCSQ